MDAYYDYIEIMLTELIVKRAMRNRFTRNFEKSGHALIFIDVFKQAALTPKTFIYPMGTLVRHRMITKTDGSRLNAYDAAL